MIELPYLKVVTRAELTQALQDKNAIRARWAALLADRPSFEGADEHTDRLASESTAGAQATYVYEVAPRTSDVKPLAVDG
jgi:hypothetical protein